MAYDMEWKIRVFIVEVLNFALIVKPPETLNGVSPDKLYTQGYKTQPASKNKRTQAKSSLPYLRLDGEKGIEQFGQRVQPDLTV